VDRSEHGKGTFREAWLEAVAVQADAFQGVAEVSQ